jgi:aminocarboxymuconate-semialdehyde decarboxylase
MGVTVDGHCTPMIDVHAHVVPDGLPFGCAGDDRWPRLARSGEDADVLIAGRVFRHIRSVCWDAGPRLAEMDTHGVTLQVVSPMPELLSYWAAPGPAWRFCAAVNEWVAEFASRHPGRFRGLGIVPLQDPARAAAMLADVAALGLTGVEIGSNINGRYLSAPRFREFFAEAARLDLLVFVHTFHPPAQGQFPPGPVSVAASFPAEITTALVALIASGVLADCPGLRVLASHGGGGAVAALGRLEHAWRHDPAVRETLPQPPSESLRHVYFDTLTFDPRALSYLIDAVGHAQVLVGSDYPFIRMPAGWTLAELADLAPQARQAIRSGNALAMLSAAGAPGGTADDGRAHHG